MRSSGSVTVASVRGRGCADHATSGIRIHRCLSSSIRIKRRLTSRRPPRLEGGRRLACRRNGRGAAGGDRARGARVCAVQTVMRRTTTTAARAAAAARGARGRAAALPDPAILGRCMRTVPGLMALTQAREAPGRGRVVGTNMIARQAVEAQADEVLRHRPRPVGEVGAAPTTTTLHHPEAILVRLNG
jgi:hypothetical protein